MAEVEKILERGAEEIKDHRIIVALRAEPAYEGDANAAGERLVDLALVFELRMFSLDGLKFDGYFLARDDVNAEVDITYKIKKNVLHRCCV